MCTVAQGGSQKKNARVSEPLGRTDCIFQRKEEAGGKSPGWVLLGPGVAPFHCKASTPVAWATPRDCISCCHILGQQHSPVLQGIHKCLITSHFWFLPCGMWHWHTVPMRLSLALKSSACNFRDPSVRAGRGLGEWGGRLHFTQRV